MSTLLSTVKPGITFGSLPQRQVSDPLLGFEKKVASWINNRRDKPMSFQQFQSVLFEIELEYEKLHMLDDQQLAQQQIKLHRKFRAKGLKTHLLAEAFAHISLAVKRLFSFEPHPEQLFAAWSMLNGNIVEMQTGEGKTLTASFPAICMAFTGTPVHVITVNDYLAKRDANTQSRLYQHFNLRCKCIESDMDDDSKRAAYKADIVYTTNKQIVFDYLRDTLTLDYCRSRLLTCLDDVLTLTPKKTIMNGLGYAIVDEADSVLIDDARVPLILAQSRPCDKANETQAAIALSIATSLKRDVDFIMMDENRSIMLTDKGMSAIECMAAPLGDKWKIDRVRHELIRQALSALHIFEKDRHYLVNEGKVELIDEGTGRVLSDRKLQHGLHQMLELKEKCTLTDASDVVAGLCFQQFFQRYCHLSGMSGTLQEVKAELSQVYGLKVICVPPHKPSERITLHSQVFANQSEQLVYALAEIGKRHAAGQPLLLGTRTVKFSELLSALLTKSGIEHELLNARQDASEAQIVARAGQAGAVTVATNMAGRGTDISLDHAALVAGGLHVINFEINESKRVDRQLIGRAARQGNPGSSQALLSLSDELVQRELPDWIKASAKPAMNQSTKTAQTLARSLIRLAQYQTERRDAKQRLEAFYRWPKLERSLGFTGDM